MVRGKKKTRSSEKGQSLIELAVSLVVLLILIAGIVDLGRAVFYFIAMRDAAQEGATYGSLNPTFCYEIENRVRAGIVDNTNVEVDIKVAKRSSEDYQYWYKYDCTNLDAEVACEGNVIQVTVKDPEFPITMPFLGTIIGRQTIVLQTTIKDTIITPRCVE